MPEWLKEELPIYIFGTIAFILIGLVVGVMIAKTSPKTEYTKAMVREWNGASDEVDIVKYIEHDDTYEITTVNGLMMKIVKEDCRLYGGNT